MPRKAFEVTVELDVQAVTCPGVWLCPTGKVTLRVCMMGSTAKTLKKPPIFPLLYHEKFIFRKTICSARHLTDLEKVLSKECLYAELVQWQGGDYGTVLATFESSLEELLYPSPCDRGLIAGVDIDLLMEPAKCFPGILSPKIEVSTKTTIEEVVNAPECDNNSVSIINPKTVCSKSPYHSHNRRQRRVCHSRPRRYRRLRGRPCLAKNLQDLRPPFVVRHVQDDLLELERSTCTPGNRCCSTRCRHCSTGPADPVWRSERQSRSPWRSEPHEHLLQCNRSPSPPSNRSPSPPSNRCSALEDKPRTCWTKLGTATTDSHRRGACTLRNVKGTRCRCGSKDKGGACSTCSGYKKYFDVCNICHYPIIATKRYPQGCLCSTPTVRTKQDTSGYRCTSTGGRANNLKSTYQEPPLRGVDDLQRCRKYPLPSCSEYPCTRKCTQCLLNPMLAGPPVEFRTAYPRHVDKPSYRDAFYHTLEKFYKKLYKRAKSRALEETDRCPL